uniref:Cytochrome P450 n=1 Tax=Panagrolaimus sp. ES5 TaxID=591445 RepID=A0AC34FUG8_9BILA
MLTLLFLIISTFAFYHFFWKRRNFPPGPCPIPLIGNTHTLSKLSPGYAAFKKWQLEYGNIYTFWIGENPVIAVNDYETIVECFAKNGQAFAGRFQIPEFQEVFKKGNGGVIHVEGDLWSEHRRFSLKVLRDFGVGKNLMQEKILDTISSFLEKVEAESKLTGKVDMIKLIDISIGSVINDLIFGSKFIDDEDTTDFYILKEVVKRHLQLSRHPMVMVMWKNTHRFKHLPIFGKYYAEIEGMKNVIFKFFDEKIKQHIENFDVEKEAEDFVDAFLAEMEKRKNVDGNVGTFDRNQLNNICFDFWIAGQETTTNSLAWGILYLMLNPKIQEKIQQEIDSVIPEDRLITMSDKPQLPYCQATVLEIQRIANVVPLNVLHSTLEDTKIRNFAIPKGTLVVPQISSVLFDEKIFPEPMTFKPERFLDSEGNLKECKEMIPFSVGKRQCLGEGLAKMELFLFVVNIFNKYMIQKIENDEISMERTPGATVSPHPFECKVLLRK